MNERDLSWRHLSALILCFSFLVSAFLMDATTNPVHAQSFPECERLSPVNVAAASVGQIETCLRARGADLMRGIHKIYGGPNLACSTVRQMFGPQERHDPLRFEMPPEVSEQASDIFCSRVAEAHQRIYGFRPYWSHCGDARSMTNTDLQSCLLGVHLSGRRRPNENRDESWGQCEYQKDAYRYGVIESALRHGWAFQNHRRNSENMTCARLSEAMQTLVQMSHDPCFVGNTYYDNRNAFIQRCMREELRSGMACSAFETRYVQKLLAANTTLPGIWVGSNDIPSCDAQQELRSTLPVSAIPLDEPFADFVEKSAPKLVAPEPIPEESPQAAEPSNQNDLENTSPEGIETNGAINQAVLVIIVLVIGIGIASEFLPAIERVRFHHYVITLIFPTSIFLLGGAPAWRFIVYTLWHLLLMFPFILLVSEAVLSAVFQTSGLGVWVALLCWFMQAAGTHNPPWVLGSWQGLREYQRHYGVPKEKMRSKPMPFGVRMKKMMRFGLLATSIVLISNFVFVLFGFWQGTRELSLYQIIPALMVFLSPIPITIALNAIKRQWKSILTLGTSDLDAQKKIFLQKMGVSNSDIIFEITSIDEQIRILIFDQHHELFLFQNSKPITRIPIADISDIKNMEILRWTIAGHIRCLLIRAVRGNAIEETMPGEDIIVKAERGVFDYVVRIAAAPLFDLTRPKLKNWWGTVNELA